MLHALGVGGAVDLDVAAPQLRPRGGLVGQQRVEAARACGARQREIGGRVAAPAVARQRDVLGEHVGLALAHRHAQVQRQPVRVAAVIRLAGHDVVGPADGHRHRHTRPVRCAAIQRHGVGAGVAAGVQHLHVAVVPQWRAVGGGRRERPDLQVVRRQRLLRHLAVQLRQRQAWLVRRPGVQRERQLRRAVVFRCDRQLRDGEMRIGLAHEAGHRDARVAAVVEIAVARGQHAAAQVQRLAIIAERGGVGFDLVEPVVAGLRVAGGIVDAQPAGDRCGSRDVARRLVHQADHVRKRALGAVRVAEGGDVAVAELARKVVGKIRRAGVELPARVVGGPHDRRGQRQPGACKQGAFHGRSPGTASKATVSRACSLRNGTVPCQA